MPFLNGNGNISLLSKNGMIERKNNVNLATVRAL
jgi:hypothetical protein